MDTVSRAVSAAKDMNHAKWEKTAIASQPAPISENYELPNRYLRCPLPGLNSNPDSLRQYDFRGRVPQFRAFTLRNTL